MILNLQLEAIRAVDVAGDPDGRLAGAGLEVQSEGRVVRGPVDEVDEVDAEGGRVGVDRGPLEVEVGASGQGRVGGRAAELDSRNQGGAEGDE